MTIDSIDDTFETETNYSLPQDTTQKPDPFIFSGREVKWLNANKNAYGGRDFRPGNEGRANGDWQGYVEVEYEFGDKGGKVELNGWMENNDGVGKGRVDVHYDRDRDGNGKWRAGGGYDRHDRDNR
jgi:hypothetical protein